MIFAQFAADGLVTTKFVTVESEHSAMTATMAASASGVRAMTATSSQGLVYMYEMLPIASAMRLPIVMPEVNRAISGPINIHCDHSDTMAARDFGWIQIFSENSQEAYDNILQAMKISEHDSVRLPSMVTTDGFIISHCMEKIEMLEDKEVQEYVGEFKAKTNLLDLDNPVTLGSLDLQNYYFEHKRQIADAMEKSKKIILEVGKEFGKKFGREYGFFESYKLEDAEVAIICLGSTAGTTKATVDEMREKGKKVGLLKLRVFRPFPAEEIAAAIEHVKAVAVLDRSDGYAAVGGPLFTEVRSGMYGHKKQPSIVNYIYGLGGREINGHDIEDIFGDLIKITTDGVKESVMYKGVRQ